MLAAEGLFSLEYTQIVFCPLSLKKNIIVRCRVVESPGHCLHRHTLLVHVNQQRAGLQAARVRTLWLAAVMHVLVTESRPSLSLSLSHTHAHTYSYTLGTPPDIHA